jgi:hypothetical protein
MKKLSYEEPRPMSRSEILESLQRAPREYSRAVLCAALFDDILFAEPLVVSASSHASPMVRGVAMTAVGHMARIHKNYDSTLMLTEVLASGLRDPEPDVRGQADDAIDDVIQFIPSLTTIGEQIRAQS